MESIMSFLEKLNSFIWGIPMLVLVMGTGLLLTIRLKFLQVKHLPRALKYIFKEESDAMGDVSSFGALCTALAATIGTGNIVGVAAAIMIGGPGALFWMWVAALLGMATKYAEGLLAVKYRQVDEKGEFLGGPFYYIEKGLGPKFKWLASLFAFFGACAGFMGIGTMVQVNAISGAINGVFGRNIVLFSLMGKDITVTIALTAVIVTFLSGLVIIGGIKRIAEVAERIVPFMAVFYVIGGLIILGCNIKAIPGAFAMIFKGAFTTTGAVGGFAGATVMLAMQKGVARGIFSNEAGLGSAPIAAAAAKTNWPARQGLVSMTGVFIDTIIICTMTGLVLITTGIWNRGGIPDSLITTTAFESVLPNIGKYIVSIGLTFFAFTTILGWDYYSERCAAYLFGVKVIPLYRIVYVATVYIGPFLTLELIWLLADIFNGAMAFPNLIALAALSGVVVSETKKFFDHIHQVESAASEKSNK